MIKTIINAIRKAVVVFLFFLIRIYQKCISPLHHSCCRFTPTCSAYALEAIQKYGPGKGLLLAIKRILKCNPYHEGGYDPVPWKWCMDFVKSKKIRGTFSG